MKKSLLFIAIIISVISCAVISANASNMTIDDFIKIKNKQEEYNTMYSPAFLESNYSSEYVDDRTRSLMLTQTDMTIPISSNETFEISRIFVSSLASDKRYTYSTAGITISDESFYQERYHLGPGWRFSFPTLEITKSASSGNISDVTNIVYHSESGAIYSIDADITDASSYSFEINNHPLKDISVDIITENNKRLYCITHAQSNVRYIFNEDGYVVRKEYKNGEKVCFSYQCGYNNQVIIDYTLDIISFYNPGATTSWGYIAVTNQNDMCSSLTFNNEKCEYQYKSLTDGNSLIARVLSRVLRGKTSELKTIYQYYMRYETQSSTAFAIEGILYGEDNRLSLYSYNAVTKSLGTSNSTTVSITDFSVTAHQDYTVTADRTEQCGCLSDSPRVTENNIVTYSTIFKYNVEPIGTKTKYYGSVNSTGTLFSESFIRANGFGFNSTFWNITSEYGFSSYDAPYVGTSINSQSIIVSNASYSNYEASMSFRFGIGATSDLAGILCNCVSGGTSGIYGYYVCMSARNSQSNNHSQASVMMYKLINGLHTTASPIEEVSLSSLGITNDDNGNLHTLRAVVTGTTIKAYVDGNEAFCVTDSGSNMIGDSSSFGHVGIRTENSKTTIYGFDLIDYNYTETYKYATIYENGDEICCYNTYNLDGDIIDYEEIGTDHKIVISKTYDDNRMPKEISTTDYNLENGEIASGDEGISKIETYKYDDFGNLIEYRGPLADKETNDVLEDYIVSYTYDTCTQNDAASHYNMPLTKTYRKNSGEVVVEAYTLTADNKNIATKTVTLQGVTDQYVRRTDYTYAGGRLIDITTGVYNGANTLEKYQTRYVYGIDGLIYNNGNIVFDAEATYEDALLMTDNQAKNYPVIEFKRVNESKWTATRYKYDISTGNLLAVMDANGNLTQYTYNQFNKCIYFTKGDNVQVSYEYNDKIYSDFDELPADSIVSNRRIIRTDEEGNRSYVDYDAYSRAIERGFLLGSGNNVSEVVYYSATYDKRGNLTSEVDGEGNVTEYSYDSAGRRIGETAKNADDSIASEVAYRYGYTDISGENLYFTTTDYLDLSGQNVIATESVYYNIAKQEVKRSKGNENPTVTTYDAAGNIVSVTDGNGHTTGFTYDRYGRLITSTKANNDTVSYEYTALDCVASKTEDEKITEYSYDAVGRLVLEKTHLYGENGGYYSKYTYDDNGNVLLDEKGKYAPGNAGIDYTVSEATAYAYNYQNLPISATKLIEGEITANATFSSESSVFVTEYAYDNCGNITEKTEHISANEEICTEYDYDYAGRVIRESIHNDQNELFSKTEYAYDTRGNILSKKTYSDAINYITESYSYDVNNKVISKTAPNGLVSVFNYDSMGNMLREACEPNEVLKETLYVYNAAGLLVEKKVLSDILEDETKIYNTTGYTYDNNENLTTITPQDTTQGAITTYEYDCQNRVVAEKVSANGTTQHQSAAHVYDSRGNIVQKKLSGTEPYITYVYDANDNVVSETENGIGTKQYTYDGSNRVVAVIDGLENTTSYTYYKNGQIKKIEYYNTDENTFEGDITYSLSDYDLSGKYKTTVKDLKGYAIVMRFDVHGNPTQKDYPDGSREVYVYDMLGRLAAYIDKANLATTYTYDACSNIVSKTVGASQYAYDYYNGLGQCVSGTSCVVASPRVTSYTYYDDNLLKSETNPLGYCATYKYDRRSLLVEFTDSFGAKETYSYNQNGEVAAKNTYYSANDYYTTTYAYSFADTGNTFNQYKTETMGGKSFRTVSTFTRLQKQFYMNGAFGTYLWSEYVPKNGRLTRKKEADRDEVYGYDSAGNVLYAAHIVDDYTKYITRYEYDNMNRVINETDFAGSSYSATAPGRTTSYEYDLNGNVTKIVLPEQNTGSTNDVGTRYIYDNMNRVTTVSKPVENLSGGFDYVVAESYEYDSAGRLKYAYKGAALSTTPSTEYVYNEFGETVAVIDALGNTTSMTYDSCGNVTSRTDARGNTTAYQYLPDGLLSSVTYPDGGEESYAYDKKGRITSKSVKMTSSTYSVTSYEYDAFDNITKTTNPDGGMVICTYDGPGRMTSRTDARGNTSAYTYGSDYGYKRLSRYTRQGVTTTYGYDDWGRLISENTLDRTKSIVYNDFGEEICVTYPDGGITSYTYDDNGNIIEKKVKRNASQYDITEFEYDVNSNCVAQTLNATYPCRTEYTYDLYGNIVREYRAATATNPAKDISYTYDAMNNLLQSTQTDSPYSVTSTTKYWYDACGNLAATKDARGYFTLYTYDWRNRLLSVADTVSDGNILGITDATVSSYLTGNNFIKSLAYTYDLSGNKLTETNALGYANTYTYDTCGRVLTVKLPNNVTSSTKTYDANGNVLSDTDGMGYKTYYTYDALDRLTSIADNEHIVYQSYTYDVYGNVLTSTDGENNVTEYEYDGMDRIISVELPDNCGTSEYTYDLAGNMLTQTDGAGHTTSYTYDAFALALSKTDAAGGVTEYEYDATLALKFKTAPDGVMTEYYYDARGNVTYLLDYSDWSVLTYEYDAVGNRISSDVDGDTYHYTYDGGNRLLTVSHGNTLESTYAYDKRGLVTSYAASGLTTNYTYDSCGRMASAGNVAYSYDYNGNLSRTTYGGVGYTDYSYDSRSRVTLVSNVADGTVSTYAYTYYNNNLQKTVVDASEATRYVYDGAGRIKTVINVPLASYLADYSLAQLSAVASRRADYTYDLSGNRTGMTEVVDETTETIGGRSVTYAEKITSSVYSVANLLEYQAEVYLDANDEEQIRRRVSHIYDGRGNEVSRVAEFEYQEDHDMLIDLELGADAAAEVTINTYNGFNRLVRSSVTSPSGQTVAKYVYDADGQRIQKTVDGVRTSYVYDRGRVSFEKNASGGITVKYLNGLSCHGENRDLETYYYFTNAHGDVTEVVDSGRDVTDVFKYDEFGGITFETHDPDSIALTSFRYANEYYDTETGNYYLRSRYYDPSIGRFTQADTFAGNITDPLSLNLYTYCHNNPINYVDPSGHEPREMTIGDSTYYYDTDDFTSSQQDYEFSFVIGAAQRGELDMGGFLSGARDFGIGMKTDIYMDLDETTILHASVSSTMTAEQFDRAISAMSEYERGYLNQNGLRYYLTANAVEICEVYASKAGISVRLRYIASLHGGTVKWCQNEYGENNASRQILPGVAAVTIGNKTARYYVGDGRGTNNVNDSLYVDKDVFYKDFDGAYGNGYGPKDVFIWSEYDNEYYAYMYLGREDVYMIDTDGENPLYSEYQGAYRVQSSAVVRQTNGYASYYTVDIDGGQDQIVFEVYNGRKAYAKLSEIESVLKGYRSESVNSLDMQSAIYRAEKKVSNLGLVVGSAIGKLYLTKAIGVEYEYSEDGKLFAIIGASAGAAALIAYNEYNLDQGTRSNNRLVSADDIKFSDKFSKPQYKDQVSKRGWTNQMIADTINNPFKTEMSVNYYTGNPVTLSYCDEIHYVAVDDITGKVVQVANLHDPNWAFDLFK